uniref:Uncharacterized protein n=1 Tax=Plectus sambesii TaxID=2011161 RepID=A0A914VC56_9BILA
MRLSQAYARSLSSLRRIRLLTVVTSRPVHHPGPHMSCVCPITPDPPPSTTAATMGVQSRVHYRGAGGGDRSVPTLGPRKPPAPADSQRSKAHSIKSHGQEESERSHGQEESERVSVYVWCVSGTKNNAIPFGRQSIATRRNGRSLVPARWWWSTARETAESARKNGANCMPPPADLVPLLSPFLRKRIGVGQQPSSTARHQSVVELGPVRASGRRGRRRTSRTVKIAHRPFTSDNNQPTK